MAVANFNSHSVSVLLGDGAGGFSAQTIFASNNPISVTTGDFNGDGKLDFATANNRSNSVSIVIGNGTGSFWEQAARL